ncbi:unnamed protein product [Tetraodon nigroviridis]|uniref:Elongator complex protein 1 n=2 Tax=Tetraodon nigroviridis TaxID=99883 RepID=Q4S496_TETNG|nr:unnamed protein product [Tetraodon nigroviridis]
MRNLKLLKSFRSSELLGPGSPQCLALRADTGSLLAASQYSIVEYDPRTGQVVSEASLTAQGFLPGDGSGLVVGLEDLAELESACLATAGGDVVLFNLNTCQLECVGSVDSGLTSMSWSPDEELVVLTTGQETIIMMTKDFEPITEVGIHQDDFGEGKFITVGWGKKETQFHGSEGKQAAQRKIQEVQPAAAWDGGRPRVTWRGDGQLFAVSSICLHTGARRVRVWNREGVLQATSEAIDGLEEALCWKPSGSLIASTRRHPNKHSVVFLEKNGLLHGDFTLPLGRDRAKVKDLLWNSDSSVLAVWLEDMAAGEDKRVSTCIQLWVVGNYHWYLKQSLDFGRDPQKAPACVCWDPESPLRLQVVTRGWSSITYDWGWTTERSPGLDAADSASRGRDRWRSEPEGSKRRLKWAQVPDAMLPSPVNQVSFHGKPPRTNQLAALTSDGHISVYVEEDLQVLPHGVGSSGVPVLTLLCAAGWRLAARSPLALRQLLWLDEDLFVAVISGLLPTSSTVLVLRPAGDADQRSRCQELEGFCFRREVEVDGVVVSMAHGLQTGTVALQLEDGRIRKLLWDCPDPSVEEWCDASGRGLSLPAPCAQTALCSIGGEVRADTGERLLGLTDRSHLYAGDTEVRFPSWWRSWSDCGELALTCGSATFSAGLQCFLLCRLRRLSPGHHTLPQLPLPPAPHTRCPRWEPSRMCSGSVCVCFRLVGTLSVRMPCGGFCLCICFRCGVCVVVRRVEMAFNPTGLQAALASGGGQNDETLRRVERGSRIVTVVPQDTRVVLQMPRGNLETVHHRSLVLAQLRSWLDSLRFRDAFECMRKLRINLNFLYDHNPKVFLENIRTFISELNSTANINLFLTELREEDTTSSMYPRPDGATVQTRPVAAPKKVDVVCDALRIAMETLDPNKYFLSILTSHVKKTIPELETALQKVHELRGDHASLTQETAPFSADDLKPPESPGSVGAEEALKYLLFLVNVNDLYEHSLGTYDFDLVLMVAEKSQKVFEDPKEYLPFLNMLRSLEQNYQRYTIDRHLKRYRKALQHLSKCGDEHFPEALQLVREQKLYAEALRLYTADSPHYKALSCAYAEHLVEQHQAEARRAMLLWRCGELTGRPAGVCQQLQLEERPKLTEQRRHAEAAVLLDQYAKDCEEAILALITGACWEEALRLIHSHGRHDITETNLKPALLEAVGTQSAFLDARVATFTRHRARLAVVREQKAKARLDMLEEDGLDCPDAELYSEASSVLTASKYSHSNSRISSRSSKNRRKAERKKLSLKEGSPMEDRALVLALSELVTTVDKMREEVSSLLKALVLFQYQRQAEALQLAFQQALQSMEAAVPEVWPEGPQSARAPLTGPNSTANSITASFQQQQSPSASQQVWYSWVQIQACYRPTWGEMRNLKLLKSFRSSELLGPGSPQCLALRADTGSLLAASQYSIVEYDPRTGQVVSEASLTAQGFLPGDGSGLVVGLEDLAELESACLATAGGDVVLFNLNTCQLECVGSVDSGLTSMSWSPDEELVVLTTGQETIIMMTKDFEPITEVGIHQDDFGEGKFITVGWGKKETQFHGSEGKQSAQRKIQEVQPAAAWDGGRPRVTWRGDGQLFAVSSICLHTGARRVRVWNREGVLQATSEAIDGLEEALCWKPSGSLIASTRRHPNKHSVVFLEKNGLLHGDFTLPLGRDRAKAKICECTRQMFTEADKVKDLLWNSDSSVLAVWLEDMAAGEDKRVSTCIQLWVVGNYHWYLKQSLDFGRDPQKAPACVCWDPESPLRLQVVTRGWSSITYDWGWTTERSPGLDAADSASVAVIDGDKVLVTTFRQGVVPPPMCSFALQLPSPVNQVSFHGKPPRTNQLAALTSDGHISVYVEDSAEQSDSPSDGFRTVSRPLVLQKTFRVEAGGQEPLALRQLLWLDEDLFVAVISGLLPTSSTVLVLRPAGDADHALAVRREVEVDGVVVSMAHGLQTGTVALQLEDGRIRKLLWDCPDPSVEEWCDASGRGLSLPAPCAQTALCSIGGEVRADTGERLLGLTDRSHLYAGDTEVRFPSWWRSWSDCGELALTFLPSDEGVFDQMPRGNLETVHHRSLVLAQLRSWLDSLRFRDAFECMRKLRINLNFLYDHNPKVFLENIRTFISELNSTANINLFLTELRYFLSILTSHVKKTVPELETALQKVHELRGDHASLTQETAPFSADDLKPPESPGSVGAEEALKYLLFLVNVNDLYEHSLGTYDFDLVLMVAEKSQKDPKEYLPFLNMLKSLEQNYQRYTIDRHLKRYRKALQHLSKCGDEHFPEALQLVREQKLYAEALRLYTADSPHYKALSCAYAEHLVEQHQAEQAGLLLWRCGELTGALQAFVSSSSWRNAVCVAQQIPLPPEHLALLARDLAAKLTEQRRHAEAAVLLDQYAKDCEEAILALITGACWEEALRLIHSHGRHDITETNLKPALLEAVGTQSAFLDARVATFTRHRARLAVVREQKAKARLDMLEEDGLDCPDAELYSEASSVLTASKYSHSNSRISSRSSKNRRKAERKKLSLKEGSPMEDRALVLALSELVTTVDKMREEVSSLLKALVLFQYQRQAEALQLAFQQALQSMEAAVPEVWPEGPQSARAPLTGPNSTANSITASFQQQQSPSASQQDADFLAPPKIRHCVKWRLSILT